MSTATILYSIQQYLFRIGGPILVFSSTVSCILNLIVFTQNTLRKSPCTICLIVINFINLLLIYLSLSFVILATGFNIDPASHNIILCRFRYYIAMILVCIEASCLILASIDRTLVTSPNARTRQCSTSRLATLSISVICVFWSVFHIHALIFIVIVEFSPDYSNCFYQSGVYTVIMAYYGLLLSGIIPPMIMILFGCWTIKNIRRVGRFEQHSRTTNTDGTAITRPRTLHIKDRQLIRILMVDIMTYIICKFPVLIFNIYQQISQHNRHNIVIIYANISVLLITNI
ncbi:hypothetical protein I4U23_022564 [Adineta vaga]|nr:hypothetical protein I4U23_022564 [Adineta vaga]